MAQSVICGTSGNVSISGRGARIAAWSADLLRQVNNANGYGSVWSQNVGGIRSLSGTASGFLTKGTANDTPNFTGLTSCDDTGVAIVLTADTGCIYYFNGLISRIRIDHNVADVARITFDFVSNGAVTEDWETASS